MKRSSVVRAGAGMALALLCTVALLAAAGSARAATVPARNGVSTWTVALYADGDNDLWYTWAQFTRPALERIPASSGLNVVAMVDSPGKHGTKLYQFTGPDGAPTRSVSTAATFPEKDFGSGATFQWFLQTVSARYPSTHLIVVGWDHGYGWRYFSKDLTSDDRITIPELRGAIAGAQVPIDVLGFDACNMAETEVTYDLATDPAAAPYLHYFVGSEETVDQDGYPYDDMFAPLAADQSRSVTTVMQDMLAGWDRYYGDLRCFNWCNLSAIDLQSVAASRTDLVDWVALLRARLQADPDKYGTAYQDALYDSIYAWDEWLVDLGMFADQLVAGHEIDDDPELLAATQQVRDDVSGAVLGSTSGSYAQWFRGLSVWLATGSDWRDYRAAYAAQSVFGADPAAGGVGWYQFLSDFNASGKADQALPDTHISRASYGLTDVYFKDATHGWATGYDNITNNAIILRTTDGGQSWTTKSPAAWYAYMFSSLAPAPGGSLWTVGSEGWNGSITATSADDGAAWRHREAPTPQYLLGVDAVDDLKGYAVGTGGAMLRTVNGGRTWTKVATAPAGDLLGLDFVDDQHGWVVADDGPSVTGSIERTDDGGATWTGQSGYSSTFFTSVDAVSDQEAWVTGGDPAGGALYGGRRVSAHGVLLHTTDGGANWTPQWGGSAVPRLNDVSMFDADNGWAVGDGIDQRSIILHTTDGGDHWTYQDPGDITFNLAAVYALDATHAWAVGDGEEILATSDGGDHWTVERGDVIGPWTTVTAASVHRGATAHLAYTVADNLSADARVTLRIRDRHGRVVKTLRPGWQVCGPGSLAATFTCTLPRGTYWVRAYAVDRAGNAQSHTGRDKFKVE